MTRPIVAAIVVNHDSGRLVERCVESLLALDWPTERRQIIVVDNASTDGSADAVAATPGVTLIRSDGNDGFGAGVNRGLRAAHPGTELFLLLNPDAWIEADALAALAAPLLADPAVGAVCPRIVFDRPYITVDVEAPAPVRLIGVTSDGIDTTAGAHGTIDADRRPGPAGRPTWFLGATSRLHLVAGRRVTVEFAGRGPVTATWAGGRTTATGSTIEIRDAPAVTHIQNEGSTVEADGTGVNRHFHAAVDDVPDESIDVFAWCGAAVLLRRAMLDEIGDFAEALFLYYEDTDLAWRGRAQGWRYVTAPEAIVHHRHSATTRQGAARTEILQHRNRVVVLLRNAPVRRALSALGRLVVTAGVATARAPLPTHHWTRAVQRWRSVGGALRLAPWAIRSRRQGHRGH